MKNIIKCKLCDRVINLRVLAYSVASCWNCGYYIYYKDAINLIIASELIAVGNFKFHFYPKEKKAYIFKNGEDIIAKISINDFTKEEAIKWRDKLKMYSVFQ